MRESSGDMLKHILTGPPGGAGSRLQQHNDYLASSAGGGGGGGSGFHGSSSRGRAQSSADVYENTAGAVLLQGQRAGPQQQQFQASSRLLQHPALNHSQLSVNNLAQRLNASQHSHAGPLNLSTLSTSKHSVNSVSPVVGAHLANYQARSQHHHHQLLHQQQPQQQPQQQLQHQHQHNLSQVGHAQASQLQQQQQQQQQQLEQRASKLNGGLDISRMSRLPSQATPSPAPIAVTSVATCATTTTSTGPSIVPLNVSWSSSSLQHQQHKPSLEPGLKEMLTSLGLLCLVSLLLALLSLTFLIRMSSVSFMPNSLISAEEFAIVYDVTLVLCALALSLNLCCLLVCAIQFLFAVKLVKSSYHGHRTNKYLQKSSISRVCAVGGFFISIPVFLTGMILYTFIQFQSTPAIVTSVFIGLGIVFCGCALVHTVFVWQKEKTNAMKALRREQYEAAAQLQRQQTLSQQQQQHHHHHHHQNHNPQQQHQQQQANHHHHQHHLQQQQPSQQQQLRSLPVSYSAASRLAASEQLHATGGGLSRASVGPQAQLHNHRHVSMSPPLLISSPANGLHHGPLNASQRAQLGPVSPPATPGDRSPTSPANKHNRSSQQLMSRELATGSVSPGLPAATLDLSSAANTNSPHELSTLV
ncbi:uncharacterized protein LOC100114149 [Nasonia vitripennis]|uniref:Uncharacterized protein n=1 Tax=Nasonia vitripennis TaxID=7425 RepID=A0A7M7QEJ1_NASVI|nr:uncharacterized protein LOC100114149 [Nasonia vitripennis]XP_031785380.1 uncharacterized protein LOC100114149 [Nasonia vitripennis]